MKKIAAGIVGFRGYSGAELESILARHPGVEVYRLEHRQDAEYRPAPIGAPGPKRMACTAEAARAAGLAVVFLATPVEVSIELTVAFLGAGIRVIDLSGAFRLGTLENFERWYPEKHQAPELLGEAVYGLPEFYRERIADSRVRLISNPGCYPTAANLAIGPLVSAGLIDTAAGVICDAKSGVSGAGRKASLKTSFCEVTENFSAYSILTHRHVPEVLMHSKLERPDFVFTAQLLPVHRGILETIYLKTHDGVTAQAILQSYLHRYDKEPFVRVYEPGQVPDLAAVAHTNFCDIGFVFDPATNRLAVISVIDNLVKGAAGQAVQNMNLAFGFAETEALL